MSVIQADWLTFYYDGSDEYIFEDASFQIDTDWRTGFVARNGRGKTTLLKLMMGEYEYRGRIVHAAKFRYFPFPVTDGSRETLAAVEEADPEYEFWKVCRELTLLGMEADVLYRPFDTLSGGEKVKVMLAVLFAGEDRDGGETFFLIDEPTDHLDMEARESVKGYLRRKKGFLLVSHDRDFLDGCIDHVLVINKHGIEARQGNFSTWWENKRRQDEYELAENERLKKEIGRLQESARTAGNWADQVEAEKIGKRSGKYEYCKDSRAYIGEKSRRMQMRRKNLQRRRQQAIEEKSALLKNIEAAPELKLIPLRHHKERLLVMENVRLFYQGVPGAGTCRGQAGRASEIQAVEGVTLSVTQGERIHLRGRNGCGKSSILKAVLREAGLCPETGPEHTGRIELASGLRISYVSQDTSMLRGGLKEYGLSFGLNETLFKAVLRKLDFSREQFDKPMEEYSSGQKKKVLIARSLCEQAHLYLWDEPLNFIDVFSRMQIEELILSCKPTLLFVEHDGAFGRKIATRELTL